MILSVKELEIRKLGPKEVQQLGKEMYNVQGLTRYSKPGS